MYVEEGRAHNITPYNVQQLHDMVTYDRVAGTYTSIDTADGGFITAVAETSRANPDEGRIVVKVFDELGFTMEGDEFVAPASGGAVEALDLAMLDNGNVALVYVTADGALRADIYGTDGALVSEQVVAESVDGATLAVEETDDGFAVSYSMDSGAGTKSVFDANGELMEAPASPRVVGTSEGDHIVGTDAGEKIYGALADDLLEGRGGDDALFGGKGADQLFGDDGNDRLVGYAGKDFLDGGAGNNKLIGGGGADVFFFDTADSVGRIVDFCSGLDRIEISTEIADSFDDLKVRELDNGNTVLRIDDMKIFVTTDVVDSDIFFV